MNPRPTRDTRARIISAATQEFARHGFAGTAVDRIAQRARVNKAMIYYHFEGKAALYRYILRELFADALDRVSRIEKQDVAPDVKLGRFVDALADTIRARPDFPAIWLREMADGGQRLDAETFGTIARIPDTLGRILGQGRAAGTFGNVHPLLLHFTIIGPLMVHLASAPVRHRLGEPAGLPALDRDVLLAHIRRVARDVAARGAVGATTVEQGASAEALP